MSEKKFYNGKVATKITAEMVGKGLLRANGISIMPEFKRDSDGKLERDEIGKAIVDHSKPIVHFDGDKATFRTRLNLPKSQINAAFKEEVTETKDIYVFVTANGKVANRLQKAVDKEDIKSDVALSVLLLCEKDGNTYKAELLDWDFAPYRRSTYHGEWARIITETIVDRNIAYFKSVKLVPEFKRDSDGKLERDSEGKAIVDATKPLINFDGELQNAKAKFRINPNLHGEVASTLFGETMEEGVVYISMTAFGFMAENMRRANDATPFDLDTRFNFDAFTKKNDKYFNGQVLGFSKLPMKKDETEDENTETSIGKDIVENAMNQPVPEDVEVNAEVGEMDNIEFPF